MQNSKKKAPLKRRRESTGKRAIVDVKGPVAPYSVSGVAGICGKEL